MTQCEVCGAEIPPERVEFLELTGKSPRCVDHSGEVAAVTFMEYGHKTAGAIVKVAGDNKEAIRLATRAYRRSR